MKKAGLVLTAVAVLVGSTLVVMNKACKSSRHASWCAPMHHPRAHSTQLTSSEGVMPYFNPTDDMPKKIGQVIGDIIMIYALSSSHWI